MHTLKVILEVLASLWFGCGFITFCRGIEYGIIESLLWILLGPLGLVFQLFGNVG